MANKPREALLLAEYIRAHFPRAHVLYDVPLGGPDQEAVGRYGYEEALALSRPYRPRVDAIIVDGKRLLLVEAKIYRWLDGIGKLPVYRGLVDVTPELARFHGWPKLMRLLIPFTNPSIKYCADVVGVDVTVFSTPALDEYINVELPNYSTRAYKRKRAEKRATMEALGLD